MFTVECAVEGLDSFTCVGTSRRKAEQKSAEMALQKLKNEVKK
jgi:ribonuclease-3